MNPSRLAQRGLNGFRKLRAGLTFQGECIWPGVQNDLYVAHLSIYEFFRPLVAGKQILDVASGSGYGTAALSEAAASVVGVDLDERNIRYSRRTFVRPNLRFLLGDAERLSESVPGQRFEMITCSNTLEHLVHPERFLGGARTLLVPSSQILIAVPPIRTAAERAANDAIPYHRSNLFVREWATLFTDSGWSVTPYLHRYGPGEDELDFGSPFRSTARLEDFTFERTDLDGLDSKPTLTALFVLRMEEEAASVCGTSARQSASTVKNKSLNRQVLDLFAVRGPGVKMEAEPTRG